MGEHRAPLAPKPAHRPRRIPFWQHLRLFRRDILSAQPSHLYGAKMAEFRTPFFRSYLLNEPQLLDDVLRQRPGDFPKSGRIAEGLRPLLGSSVFLTNGETWARQRRIIDPAFAGGRLQESFAAMRAAGEAAQARLVDGPVEIEAAMSHAAADVIFRTLFSLPIEDAVAAQVFRAFRRYQRSQPLINLAAFLPLPSWLPRPHRRATRAAAAEIRHLFEQLVADRLDALENGTAPDDLATKILTTKDPQTGDGFSAAEMVDQVAIFFLAGHETSASSLSWALYLLSLDPVAQDRVREEAKQAPSFRDVKAMRYTRDVFREALRLYPPVPMMVREASQPERFRKRVVQTGGQLVLSPWHLHRAPQHWDAPDRFWPERFATAAGASAAREVYLPFSAGPRVCPGAGFAMLEGPLLLSMLVAAFEFSPVPGREPVPVAHLTVRGRDGIWLNVHRR
ncbi:MAG: cytochrome P450 [Pseudomonadota bacterium]